MVVAGRDSQSLVVAIDLYIPLLEAVIGLQDIQCIAAEAAIDYNLLAEVAAVEQNLQADLEMIAAADPEMALLVQAAHCWRHQDRTAIQRTCLQSQHVANMLINAKLMRWKLMKAVLEVPGSLRRGPSYEFERRDVRSVRQCMELHAKHQADKMQASYLIIKRSEQMSQFHSSNSGI